MADPGPGDPRKALRETATGQEAERKAEPEIAPKTGQMTKIGSKAGEAGDHRPPAAEARPDHRISGDSSDSSSGSSAEVSPDAT